MFGNYQNNIFTSQMPNKQYQSTGGNEKFKNRDTVSNTGVKVREYVKCRDIWQPSKPVLTVVWASVVHAC